MPITSLFRKDSPKAKKSYQGVKISQPYSTKPGTPSRASLETLEKFPSESKQLEDCSRYTQGFSPLDSHNSPKPSTNSQPHLPHLSAIPPALYIRKSLLTVRLHTGDNFEEIDLGTLKHYSTEAPPSFVKEVDNRIARNFDVESLYSPDTVEKDYFTKPAESSEPTRNLSLCSNKGRYAPKRETKALVRNISAGPYFTSDTLTDNEDKDGVKDNMNTHRTFWFLLAFVVGAMAVAGIVLATVAVQKRALTSAMVTVVLGLSSQGVTATEMPSMDFTTPSLTSTYEPTTLASHMSRHPKAKMTSSTVVSNQVLNSVTEREEAIAFDAPDQTTLCTTTTTVTLTSTVYAGHVREERRGVATTSSRGVKGLYVAPDLDAILKRTIIPHYQYTTTTVTQHTTSNEKPLPGPPIANAAAPRIVAPRIVAPPLFHKRVSPATAPDRPVEKLSFLEAYLALANFAVGLCTERQVYINKPAGFHFSEDDEMANRLAQSLCATALPPCDYTRTCLGEKEWHEIYTEAKRVCAMPMPTPTNGGVKGIPGFVDTVEEFCGELGKYESVEGCVDPASLSVMGAKVRRGNGTLDGFTWPQVGSGDATSSGIVKRQAPPPLVQTPFVPFANIPTPPVVPVAHLPTPPVFPITNIPTPPPALPLVNTTTPPGLGVLPTHYSLTPPPSWSSIPMLTFSSQALNSDYESKFFPTNTIPASLSFATPPPYTGPKLPSKSWADNHPFPIPTGYVSPNIVPKEEQIGDLTWNTPGLGACGFPAILNNEFAVAISWVLFDIGREIGGSSLERDWQGELPGGISWQSSALCNRWINVWMSDGKGRKGAEHALVVRDRCIACNVTHLDIQKGVYERIWANASEGRVQVTWEWMQEGPTGLPALG
jgi:hypothetical protein